MRKILTIAMLLAVSAAQSQNLELGLWGGTTLYTGDLSPTEVGLYPNELSPGGGIFLRLNPVRPISLRLGLNLGRVSARDGVSNDRTDRNLNFRSNITELALTAEWNMFRLGDPSRMQFVPYIFAGGALFRFNPEAEFDGNYIELQPLGTEGQGLDGYGEPYSLTQFSIPGGGGLKFIFKERITIGVELGIRKTFTDYLDDVSNVDLNYLDILEGNGSLAAQLSNPNIKDPEVEDVLYRRGGEFDDWYFFGGLTFSFAFGQGSGIDGRGIGCPTF